MYSRDPVSSLAGEMIVEPPKFACRVPEKRYLDLEQIINRVALRMGMPTTYSRLGPVVLCRLMHLERGASSAHEDMFVSVKSASSCATRRIIAYV